MSDKKEKRKFPVIMYVIITMTAFFLSLSLSALICIKADNLVFSENEKELKRITALLGTKEERKQSLEKELSRYKALYDNAIDASANVYYTETDAEN